MARQLMKSKSFRLGASSKDVDSPVSRRDLTFTLDSQGNIHDLTGKPSPVSSRADSAFSRPRTSNGGIESPSNVSKPDHISTTVMTHDAGFDFTQSPKAFVFAAEIRDDDDTIGMALGSPSHPPTGFGQLKSSNLPNLKQNSYASFGKDGKEERAQWQKPKVSRWKAIFSRKQTEPPPTTKESFYQVQQPLPSQRRQIGSEESVHAAFKSPVPLPQSMPEVDDVEIADPAVQKAHKKRAIFAPRSDSLRRTGPAPPPKDDITPAAPPEIPKLSVSRVDSLSPEAPPLLDIEIPTIQMERYSIMFGSLLGSSGNSSLLVRRQGNADKLAPLEEKSLNV
jgi:hypothetical protein